MRSFGLLFLLAASAAFAGESVILTSGSRMHVDRHETEGGVVRLYSSGGYIEMDATQVHSFEADPVIDPPPAPPIAVVAPVVPGTPPVLSPQDMADAAADKYGLPRKLVRSVIAAESAFQTKAISPKGAIGLMQLMPGTALTLGVDPNDPIQNIDGGARYLRDLLVKYDGLLWHALAAYNAGPGAVDKYKGVPPYRETIEYVKRIDTAYNK